MAEKKQPDTVILSLVLVQDIVNYLGTQPLAQALPLFNRVVTETRGQIAAEPPKADVDVPDGPPAKATKKK